MSDVVQCCAKVAAMSNADCVCRPSWRATRGPLSSSAPSLRSHQEDISSHYLVWHLAQSSVLRRRPLAKSSGSRGQLGGGESGKEEGSADSTPSNCLLTPKEEVHPAWLKPKWRRKGISIHIHSTVHMWIQCKTGVYASTSHANLISFS